MIVGEWELLKEGITLGGMLIFRQELEMLAFEKDVKSIRVHFLMQPQNSNADLPKFISHVLMSQYQFCIESGVVPVAGSWPVQNDRSKQFFSYQSFSRVVSLWKITNRFPELMWDKVVLQRAALLRDRFIGKIFTIHLKRVSDNLLDSNADFNEWLAFFKKQAVPGKVEFLILGSDKIPQTIIDVPGVYSAEALGFSLSEQLTLVGLSDGFLGMASGLCQAAILSKVPYVIFKHPQHHADEMRRELGEHDGLPFALGNQRVLRMPANVVNINNAFQTIG